MDGGIFERLFILSLAMALAEALWIFCKVMTTLFI